MSKAAEPNAILPREHFQVFEKYCLDCHDAETQEGKINLEGIPFDIAKDIPTAERWAKILNAINSGEMPPKDNEPIADDHKADFLEALSTRMVVARKILSDSGGVVTMRRLNRREYQNTLESLLGVRPDVSDLPDDQATTGFDTSGASLFFSSDQFEQYLTTARRTLALALKKSPDLESKTVRVEPEEYYNRHYAQAAEELRDRESRAKAFLAQSEKPASDFGLLDAYQAKRQIHAEWLPQLDLYLQRPETKTGVTMIMTIKQGGHTKVKLPVLGPRAPGKYLVRVRAGAYPDAEERFHYLEFSTGLGTGRTRLGWRKVTASLDDPQVIEFPVVHRPGEKQQLWIHQRTHQDRGDKNLATIDMKKNGIGTPPGTWIDWAELVGPLPESISRQAAEGILAEKPAKWSEDRYVKSIITRFATRAFRGVRPNSAYLDRLESRYQANRSEGQKQIAALIDPLAIILSSPSFLYMVESKPTKSSDALSGTELAVRLSYFLWSEPPDDELMELASRRKLSDPKVLREQTTRMLADARADRFVRGFTHQWLQMDRLDMFQFHGSQYPTFDNAVRECARQEIYETIHYMLAGKLPLRTLLKTDFVVVNDLLAGYYGIEGVEGHGFRKVRVPRGSIRGGLLGTAAILAMGSDGIRSSPVERGAWVLRHLLNDPPPPAPPNVPQLSRLAGTPLPARELARAHQEQPQCAQCHQKIDPIGYGLENFDAAGLWRDDEVVTIGKRRKARTKKFSINPTGRLPGNKKFDDYFGLRDAIAEHDEEFARGFTEALITYGLGRPFGFTDEELATEMMQDAKQSEYEMSDFIHSLVQSEAFRTK